MLGQRLVTAADAGRFQIPTERRWSLDVEGGEFRLTSEARLDQPARNDVCGGGHRGASSGSAVRPLRTGCGEAAAEEIFRQSEQLDREAIRAIPDGTYTAEGFLDSEGDGRRPVRIKVKITVEDERLIFDLTDTAGPGQGPINCGAVQTLSACRLAFKYLFNSHQPVNVGTFRPLDVLTRPGSILAARSPAAASSTSHPWAQ